MAGVNQWGCTQKHQLKVIQVFSVVSGSEQSLKFWSAQPMPSSLGKRQSRTTQKFIRFKNKVLVSSHPHLYSGFYSVLVPSIVDECNVFLQISEFCWVKELSFCKCHKLNTLGLRYMLWDTWNLIAWGAKSPPVIHWKSRKSGSGLLQSST